MEELETIRRQIETSKEVQSLVRVMKTLAAVRVREYSQRVNLLAEYSQTVELGLQVLMQNRPRKIRLSQPPRRRFGIIIFGSEQGLCGEFNEMIAAYAVRTMKESAISGKDSAVIAVGERVTSHLQDAGQPVEECLPFFTDHFNINDAAGKVLAKIGDWNAKRQIDTVLLFHNASETGGYYRPHMQCLLPVDRKWLITLSERKWPGRTIPMFTLDWDNLFSALIRRLLFLSIYRTFVESLACENASRLRTMQAAARNIEDRLDELNVRFRSVRQAAITSELLDIVTGYKTALGEEFRQKTF